MIKSLTIILILAFIRDSGFSQLFGTDQQRDSLKHKLAIAKDDTSRVLAMADIANAYFVNNSDSGNKYGNQALALAQQIQYSRGEISALNALGLCFQFRGEYAKSLEYLYRSLQIAEEKNYVFEEAVCYSWIGTAYWFLADYSKSVDVFNKSQKLFEAISGKPGVSYGMLLNMIGIGQSYVDWNQLDSAYRYLSESYNATLHDVFLHPIALYNLGDCLFKRGNRDTAFNYVRGSIVASTVNGDYITLAEAYAVISRFFKITQLPDSAVYYAKKGFAVANVKGYEVGVYKNSKLLAEEYEQLNVQEALRYRKIFDSVNEEMYGAKKVQNLQKTLAEEQQRQQQIQEEQIEKENQLKQYGFSAGLAIMLLIGFILYRNNRHKQKAYTLLQKQKEEIDKQKREAEIEAALERVRAKTMAMRRSEELADVATVLFQQIKALGVPQWTCGFCIWEVNDKEFIWYPGSVDGKILEPSSVPLNEHPIFRNWVESRKRGDELYIYEKKGDVQAEHYRYMMTVPGLRESLQDMLNAGFTFPAFQIDHVANFAYGNLLFITYEHFPEMHDVFKRFAKIFEQTYTRFLDLKKAEAQAREAQIEASLERVRARTMAMHNSEEVTSATETMFDELKKLSINNLRCGIAHIHSDRTFDVFGVTNLAGGNMTERTIVRGIGLWDMTLHPWWQQLYEQWINKDDFLYYFLAAEDKDNYVQLLNARPDYLPRVIQQLPDCHLQSYYFGEGVVWSFSLQPHSEEDKQIMKRFASVFSLTFRRYQDLKKAETQAREAIIEGALERVRSRTNGMSKSDELRDVIQLVFQELESLRFGIHAAGFLIDFNKENWNYWVAIPGRPYPGKFIIPDFNHPLYNKLREAKAKGLDGFSDIFSHKEKNTFMLHFFEHAGDVTITEKRKQFILSGAGLACSFAIEKNIMLFIFNYEAISFSEAENVTLKRFANTFEQTYVRFLDLQKAEAGAREAVKQAALDRIRADIASMRTMGDLDRITPLIWNELTTLNIPFIRCGVFIMDDAQKLSHTFLSTPDGKAIAAFHLSYDTSTSFANVVNYWKQKIIYVNHWDKSEFANLADSLVQQGAIANRDQYMNSLPLEGVHLHFLPFLQGMLYVGNTARLAEEQIELIQAVADAFSTAYARYEDFNKLELAKQQIEKTYSELKSTQAQLIQSEKMASLGELTAGIAHEIQNPLNFVNNFSEVNDELISELVNEVDNGNTEEVRSLANDIKQNLEKISHHGKRADAIVKGMLQHSRVSTGKKELIDINALADEYLRLSYHGLRAKDKSFEVTVNTNFDSSIGKISIVPQDIGRVILNVINNAFYAVNEKKKVADENYQPTVSIQTKKLNNKIEMKIVDNGNGIPQKVLDKIFQPFFTTKPTGQGTGLGLSLSYDIIKAHGGEIKAETKAGEETKFIIELPAH